MSRLRKDCREIDRGRHVPVGLDKGFPCRLPLAIRRRFNAVSFEDIADRPVGNVVSQVGRGPLNPVVAPRRVFVCDAKDQLFNLIAYRRPARFLLSSKDPSCPLQQAAGAGRRLGEVASC